MASAGPVKGTNRGYATRSYFTSRGGDAHGSASAETASDQTFQPWIHQASRTGSGTGPRKEQSNGKGSEASGTASAASDDEDARARADISKTANIITERVDGKLYTVKLRSLYSAFCPRGMLIMAHFHIGALPHWSTSTLEHFHIGALPHWKHFHIGALPHWSTSTLEHFSDQGTLFPMQMLLSRLKISDQGTLSSMQMPMAVISMAVISVHRALEHFYMAVISVRRALEHFYLMAVISVRRALEHFYLARTVSAPLAVEADQGVSELIVWRGMNAARECRKREHFYLARTVSARWLWKLTKDPIPTGHAQVSHSRSQQRMTHKQCTRRLKPLPPFSAFSPSQRPSPDPTQSAIAESAADDSQAVYKASQTTSSFFRLLSFQRPSPDPPSQPFARSAAGDSQAVVKVPSLLPFALPFAIFPPSICPTPDPTQSAIRKVGRGLTGSPLIKSVTITNVRGISVCLS
ncbi:unnamed protein product [Closterium sp. NIES-65]|nr:unnamed protein product [Closterium sp. NIES-65]